MPANPVSSFLKSLFFTVGFFHRAEVTKLDFLASVALLGLKMTRVWVGVDHVVT